MFIKRTTKPANNKYYIRKANGGYSDAILGKPTDSTANVLANCVGYANGRFAEIQNLGYIKYQLVCNAEDFINRAKVFGLTISQKPTLGGIMVWSKGRVGVSSDGAGHVAVVEEIIDSNTVYTSESGYGASSIFWNSTRRNTNGNWGQSLAYTYLGCIVNPAVKDEEKKDVIAVDGDWGKNTTMWTQKLLGTIVDGIVSRQPRSNKKYLPNAVVYSAKLGGGWEFKTFYWQYKNGSDMVRALQKYVGAEADGWFGPKSVKALQSFLKAKGLYDGDIDGYLGPNSVIGWQKYVNSQFK